MLEVDGRHLRVTEVLEEHLELLHVHHDPKLGLDEGGSGASRQRSGSWTSWVQTSAFSLARTCKERCSCSLVMTTLPPSITRGGVLFGGRGRGLSRGGEEDESLVGMLSQPASALQWRLRAWTG